MACLQNTRKNSVVWPRDITDDPPSLAFEAIETIIILGGWTIIWKLPIAPVVRIVSKYFETTVAIGTIRTIIWKLGLNKSGYYKGLLPFPADDLVFETKGFGHLLLFDCPLLFNFILCSRPFVATSLPAPAQTIQGHSTRVERWKRGFNFLCYTDTHVQKAYRIAWLSFA